MIISTFYKETPDGNARAEVHQNTGGYCIEYYDWSGSKMAVEQFPAKSVHYVESAAENWALGFKQLNG